jgi:hypothetical protein
MAKAPKLAKKIMEFAESLSNRLKEEGEADVLRAAIDGYPSEHIRTGAASGSFYLWKYRKGIQVRNGVRKRKSKTGKRRKSRTGKINYAQFIAGLWDMDGMNAALDRALERISEDA